ncbi:glycosyltransferase family 2 protein [Shewanella japonica]|uniref:glycosyltransferase family 2 protein n=1 Tax=Shewanella japonica TaxID=93973 RepID=UPI0024947B48|nr:glycosyltransferase family 2 protein [Shewanella japonica]
MWFRKLVVIVAKSTMKCLPQTWVDTLKQSPYLLAMYSKNIHYSGLMYQLPTASETQTQYDKYLRFQHKKIQCESKQSLKQCSFNVVICIDAYDEALLVRTLQSIRESVRESENKASVILWARDECLPALAELANQYDELTITLVSELNKQCLQTELLDSSCFVVFSGDVISAQLPSVIAHFALNDSTVAYVDTDIMLQGQTLRSTPDFKPDWNPDLQLTNGYIRTGVWLKSLRFFADTSPHLSTFCIVRFLCYQYLVNRIVEVQHIPLTLVSRVAAEVDIHDGIDYLSDLISQYTEVRKSQKATLHLRWPLQKSPLVSLIIPTRNGKALVEACIESILNKTDYKNYEILLVDNNSDDIESLQYFDSLALHPKVSLIRYPAVFNYSAINNFAVKQAKGSIIGLVNNDIEVISASWLTDMVGQVLRDDIGCVGAKLIYASGRIQHAGVILGYGGGAGHAHKYFMDDHPGYNNRLIASHNFSAVTAACLLVNKSDFEAVGGLNEQNLAVAFNDVDFCLKIQNLGLRNLFCAEAVLYHHESISRGAEDTVEKQLRFKGELEYLQATWCEEIKSDPAYNRNLTLHSENFAIKDYPTEIEK